ncbi:hypothetical protein BAY59_29705 [Prauserella coralliicola]|nr:hypothetical protein BAY59_29705 [Prauserella coralliicola]
MRTPAPLPVQLAGTELPLEFLGDSGENGRFPARRGTGAAGREICAPSDLSPYNVLVHDGRLPLIDLRQVPNVVSNPRGAAFLERDVRNMAMCFAARGPATAEIAEHEPVARLRRSTGAPWGRVVRHRQAE